MKKKYSFKELMKKVTPTNQHPPLMNDPPVGNEFGATPSKKS